MQTLAERPRRLPRGQFAEWLAPDDGDTLFGIEAMARYLALPFLDVRTMLGMGRLPAWKAGRAHSCRRSILARHWLAEEAREVPARLIGDVPDDIGPDDVLGLLSGQPAIADYLGVSHSGVRHARERKGLRLFWIGKTPFARRASIDRWREATSATRSERRLATILADRRALCAPGMLVGVAEIAAFLGRTPRSVFQAIYAGRIPAERVGKGWAAYPAALVAAGMIGGGSEVQCGVSL